MVSDNGTCFVSEVFQTFMGRNGIRHIKVAPKHPASNGLAEHSVQSVKEGINKMTTGSLKVGEVSVQVQKYTAFHHWKIANGVLFGRKVRTHLDHMHPDEAKALEEQQLKQKVITTDMRKTDKSMSVTQSM